MYVQVGGWLLMHDDKYLIQIMGIWHVFGLACRSGAGGASEIELDWIKWNDNKSKWQIDLKIYTSGWATLW